MTALLALQLNAIEVGQLAKELHPYIGAYVDNVYQYERQHMLFQLRKGKKAYLHILPHVGWLSTDKEEAPEKVGGFCTQLRKLLNNRRIEGIEQVGSERILKISFRDAALYIELYGKGNILLVEDSIKAAQFSIAFEDRKIGVGEKYTPPERENLYEIKEIKLGGEPVSKTLAQLGLGKRYAEEVCRRADVSPHALQADPEAIIKSLRGVLEEDKPEVKDGLLTLFSVGGEKYKTMSEAIHAIMQPLLKKPDVEPEAEKFKKKMEKAVSMQEKRVEELQKEEAEYQRKAEVLYEHYQKVDALLKEVQKYYKGPNWADFVKNAKPLLKEVDEKNKEILIYLED
ncbi:hypothetical protein CMO91_01960 [Candidatus Woesearchaeota archaeon]|nr:hypothetical protein [Candidatus Woesearchaeota archaeon]|tara:strand:- start:167 stop:1192 length:1026 start_codon:yes stop_codon:yes gene_type:complete